MWVSLMQSVKDLKRKRLRSPRKEGIPLADNLQSGDFSINTSLGLQPAAHPANFGLAGLHNHTSQFFKINLSYVVHKA